MARNRFFQEAEEPKSMREYCEDLEQAVADVRAANPNADNDPGFKQAADTIAELVENGIDMEDVWPWDLSAKNDRRKELLNKLGEDRNINVTGEASKQLAIKYRELMQALYNKEYWPVSSATVYRTTYASRFEGSKPNMQRSMDILKTRIDAFEQKQQVRRAV